MKKTVDFSTITACGECCTECRKKVSGVCKGCIEADGYVPEWAGSGRCKIHACTREHTVQFCGVCDNFPCRELTSVIHWNPNIVEHLSTLAEQYRERKNGTVRLEEMSAVKKKIPSILLTAFKGTSSERLLYCFDDSYSKLLLENDKGESVNQLISTLQSGTYDCIISFGQKPAIKDKVYIELVGRMGDVLYETDFKVDRFASILMEYGFLVRASSNAGTSFCNYIYVHGLKYIMEKAYEARMIFVHVPFAKNISDFEHFSNKLAQAVERFREEGC